MKKMRSSRSRFVNSSAQYTQRSGRDMRFIDSRNQFDRPYVDSQNKIQKPFVDTQKKFESQYSKAQRVFKEFVPLLGNEYFFPNLPLGGRINSSIMDEFSDSDDEDEYNRFFDSKVDFFAHFNEVAQYPDDIRSNITNIDTNNFDVVSFLSTDTRDYLVRNDFVGTRLEVDSLKDKKWVMICCFYCPIYSHSLESLTCRAVSDVCSDLYARFGDSFEMVLVFKMRMDFQDDELAFKHMLSGFPSSCLVIPFWDSHSRDSVCCSLGFSVFSFGLFVRPDEREVIWHKGLAKFTIYGVDSFPFTDEVRKKIHDEERKMPWNCQSLEKLFCCSSSMVLSKNSGGANLLETTSIEQLKGKLVGVYLCENGESIPMLNELYERCKAMNLLFEVVIVYFPFKTRSSDPKLFQEFINRALEKRKISWWVLPFKSWVSLRLIRLCKVPLEEDLIFVGKGVVDPDGAYFIRQLEKVLLPRGYKPHIFDDSGPTKVIDEFKSKYSESLPRMELGPGAIKLALPTHPDQHGGLQSEPLPRFQKSSEPFTVLLDVPGERRRRALSALSSAGEIDIPSPRCAIV